MYSATFSHALCLQPTSDFAGQVKPARLLLFMGILQNSRSEPHFLVLESTLHPLHSALGKGFSTTRCSAMLRAVYSRAHDSNI